MKLTPSGQSEEAGDVVCDMCGLSTRVGVAGGQFGTLHAAWGEGSGHSGDVYELHLCEGCFFSLVSDIKRTRWASVMLEDEGDAIQKNDAFGRVSTDGVE